MNTAIFILGAHKSGTSLVRSLLDGHPDLNVVPIELHFLRHLGVESQNLLRNDRDFEGFKLSFKKLILEYHQSGNVLSDAALKAGLTSVRWIMNLMNWMKAIPESCFKLHRH